MRVRVRFVKLGKVRFLSHRDLARVWERALRKAAVPVAYTEGFSPRPRIAFGLALSTGHESVAEYLDIQVAASAVDDLDVPGLPDRLSPALPEGVEVTAAAALEPGAPSLQEAVTSCTWRIEAVGADADEACVLAEELLSTERLILSRTRKGKEVVDDLRPAVLSVSVAGPTAVGAELVAELGVHPRSVRPAELLVALAPPGGLREGRVLRVAQWVGLGADRREPLAVASPREDLHVRDRILAPAGAAQAAGALPGRWP